MGRADIELSGFQRFWHLTKRVYTEFFDDRIPTVAGRITFFVLLAIFPAIAAAVSPYGMMADPSAIARDLDLISAFLPEGALTVLHAELHRLTSQRPAALNSAFAVSFVIALCQWWLQSFGRRSKCGVRGGRNPRVRQADGQRPVVHGRAAIRKADAILIGPGLMDAEGATALVKQALAAKTDGTFVLDALALCDIQNYRDIIKQHRGNIVLTPHHGEMAALLGIEKDEIDQDPLRFARAAAENLDCCVILKSDITCIASPDGDAWEHKGGSSDWRRPARAMSWRESLLASLRVARTRLLPLCGPSTSTPQLAGH
jgi:hypothetical protein